MGCLMDPGKTTGRWSFWIRFAKNVSQSLQQVGTLEKRADHAHQEQGRHSAF
jgi:hypothetical protein